MTRYFEDIIRDEHKGLRAGLLSIVLWILSLIYGCGIRMVNAGYDIGLLPKRTLPKPVISIGNITVGGSGKTPLVIWLVKRLMAEGYKPAVLTRGYRSQNQGPFSFGLKVAAMHQEGNDEVQMMHELCPDVPVIVGKDRFEMATLFLCSHHVDVFVMDDGFQHRRLARNLDIVAVESLRGFGNGHVLPRGTLREPLSGLKRADIVVLTKLDVNPDGERAIQNILSHQNIQKPVIRAHQNVSSVTDFKTRASKNVSCLKNQSVFILSSIADPLSFEQTLKRQGARVEERLFFPDHYDYQAADLQRAVEMCRSRSLRVIVTTHKDAVKLDQFLSDIPSGLDIWILNIECRVTDHEDILFQRIHHLLRA